MPFPVSAFFSGDVEIITGIVFILFHHLIDFVCDDVRPQLLKTFGDFVNVPQVGTLGRAYAYWPVHAERQTYVWHSGTISAYQFSLLK